MTAWTVEPLPGLATSIAQIGTRTSTFAHVQQTATARVYGPRTQTVMRDTGGCGTYQWARWVMRTESEVRLLTSGVDPTSRVRWFVGGVELTKQSSAESAMGSGAIGPAAEMIVDYRFESPQHVWLAVRSVDVLTRSIPFEARIELPTGTAWQVGSTLEVEPDLIGFLPDDALAIARCRLRLRAANASVDGDPRHPRLDGFSPAELDVVRQIGAWTALPEEDAASAHVTARTTV